MSEATAPKLDVAVALIIDPQLRLLWTWNARWGAFALPMTKLRKGEGVSEDPQHAAARAGAEALGVPVERLAEGMEDPVGNSQGGRARRQGRFECRPCPVRVQPGRGAEFLNSFQRFEGP